MKSVWVLERGTAITWLDGGDADSEIMGVYTTLERALEDGPISDGWTHNEDGSVYLPHEAIGGEWWYASEHEVVG